MTSRESHLRTLAATKAGEEMTLKEVRKQAKRLLRRGKRIKREDVTKYCNDTLVEVEKLLGGK